MRIGVLLALLAGILAVAPCQAQPRMSTYRMTCQEAVEKVRREGDTRLPVGGTFERFVRDRSFCDLLEIAELRFVPTRDNPQCPVGYRCREPDYEDWNWD